jgi:polysaccharide export outer membrane protein
MWGSHPRPCKEKRNKGQQPVNSQAKGSGVRLTAIIILGLCLVAGCARSSQQVLMAQALSTKKAPDSNHYLQQQVVASAPQDTRANYKDYQVGPEDELSIVILGQDKLNRELRVNGQGEIDMPLVGTVKVGGMTPHQVERRLEELYDANYLVNPQITVKVKEYRYQRVAVTGAVAKPGSYEIIGPRSLLEVLSLAGGFINQGYPGGGGPQAGDVVDVIRHQSTPDQATSMKTTGTAPLVSAKTQTIVIDLKRLVSGQDPQLNIPIRSGDVVHVPFAGTAYVLGGVRKPGNVSVKEHLTVSQAVAMAGGVDPLLGTKSITVMRLDDHGQPTSINANLANIVARTEADPPLRDNDVVVVNESKTKKTLYLFRQLLPLPSGSYPIGY